MNAKSAKPVFNSDTKDQKTSAALRAAFMRNLTQTLKTKTGAVQTAAVKRIFPLAVRSLPDDQLSGLNRLLDYTPRGMCVAYYVNWAEHVIVKLAERGPVALAKPYAKGRSYLLAAPRTGDQPPNATQPRGAGLAWVGRHPERESDEQLVKKSRPPVTMQAVLARMGMGMSPDMQSPTPC